MTPPASSLFSLDKYQAVGNDFLVVVDTSGTLALDADFARRQCDRHLGIGADGLILATTNAGDGPPFGFRLWNADGSEAEMSGNGMRCLAQAVADAGLVPGWSAGESSGPPVCLVVATPAGPKAVTLWATADPDAVWGSVEMGTVTVGGEPERCNVGHGQLLVDVGNPHLVVAGPDPATLDVRALGAPLERSRPGGINVEFVTLGPGPDELSLRVYERGVGETLACGTGAVAAAAAFAHWGRVGAKVTVHQPGGPVEVHLLADGRATLSGPSRHVARCLVRQGAARPTAAVAVGASRGRP